MSTKIKVGIIDYNVGNLSFVSNAVSRLGFQSVISNKKEKLESCSHLILPGVGAFDEASRQLNQSGLVDFLNKSVLEKRVPILGICLGMQLMLDSGLENGFHEGLGWLEGSVEKIETNGEIKLP